jgi:rubrerythrin
MTFSINEIIEFAVQIEKNGYTFYDNALKRKDLSADSRTLLTHLRDEEIAHEITFTGLRDELNKAELDASGEWDMVGSYLKTIAEAHIFHDEGSSIKVAVQAKDEREIFLNAVSFEKDTLLFFHSLGGELKNEKAKKIVKQIIDEESDHVMRLKEYYDKM